MAYKKKTSTEEDSNLIEKVIYVNRVSKVVKGGRRFSFSAIVVVGDGDGNIGVGFGKANEVPEAIRKGGEKARKTMKAVPLVDGTIPHEILGKFGASRVMLRPASAGTGVIAGPVVRAIMDAVGVRDILTKSLRSGNPHNLVRATFNAFDRMESPEQYAERLGADLEVVYSNYSVRKNPTAQA